MTGAEALLVVGIVANIVQLVEFTSKAVGRVKDFAQDLHSIPKSFRDIQITLPLLASTLSKTEDQVNSGQVDEQTCKALRPVLEACETELNELKAIFIQALPPEGASRWTRGRKAVSTLGKDKKVEDIAHHISELRLNLIHYHVMSLEIRDGQRVITAGYHGPSTSSPVVQEQQSARQRELEERCLHSLAFPAMDSRRLGIDEPAEETCNWIFEHPLYQQWESRSQAAMSHGLLWIKGKPGSGKSTLMKRLVERTEEQLREGGTCISFFFSARGAGFERSIEGLYRSLTHQLVWQRRTLLKDLAALANVKETRYGCGNWTWHVKELRDFFHASIAKAVYGPLTVFVDALDECKDDDVQEAVTAFERSAVASIANGAVLDICWSSRHYPHIRVRKSLMICMEHQNAKDIVSYVRNKVQDSSLIDHELESEIIRKANGVFMWVVLVFRQLLDAEDQGHSRAEKKKILEDLPAELNDLFRRILRSVKPRHWQTRTLLFQYAMVAREPLSARDMQLAIAFSANPPPKSIESWLSSESYLEPRVAFPNFVREVSGGLLELSFTEAEEVDDSKGKRLKIQFIHESVRDFMQSAASHGILGIASVNEIFQQGHQNLRDACLAYLSSQEVLGNLDRLVDSERRCDSERRYDPEGYEGGKAKYSFMRYAASTWPFHARRAEYHGQSQGFLVQLTTKIAFHGALKLWAAIRFKLGPFNRKVYPWRTENYGPHSVEESYILPTNATSMKEVLLWVSCAEGIVSCIRPLIQAGEDRKIAWREAANSRRLEVIRELLDNSNIAKMSSYPFASDKTLHYLLWTGGPAIVEVLLEYGFSANSRDETGQTPMQMVASYELDHCALQEKVAIIKTLAVHGADLTVRHADGDSLLHRAVVTDPRPEIISSLIDLGVDIKAVDCQGQNVLHRVARPSFYVSFDLPNPMRDQVESLPNEATAVRTMLAAGADASAQDKKGNTPLHLAMRSSEKFHQDVYSHPRYSISKRLVAEAQRALLSIVRALTISRAVLTARNNDGLTPMDYLDIRNDDFIQEVMTIFARVAGEEGELVLKRIPPDDARPARGLWRRLGR